MGPFFSGLSSAQNPDTVDHGTVTRDHGIRTARFRPTPSRGVESVGDERGLAAAPGLAAHEAGLAASEPRLPAPAV